MRFRRSLDLFCIFVIRLSAGLEVMVPDKNFELTMKSTAEIIRQQAVALTEDFDVRFYLFTFEDPLHPQPIIDGDLTSLLESNFNHRNPTRIIITGWLGNTMNIINRQLTRAYLERGSYNVINVDWSDAAVDVNYVASAAKTPRAGRKLASFIDFLISKAHLDVNTTYLIGHSLGAQIAGFAGKLIRPNKINTIFGLDPASPLFHVNKTDEHLAKGDALYVETIHSDAGVLGEKKPIGDASFYPGYGRSQPGCLDVTTLCDHFRAVKYFYESLEVTNEYCGAQCHGIEDIDLRNCKKRGISAYMGGEPSNFGRNVAGIYYVPVNYKTPHGMGEF